MSLVQLRDWPNVKEGYLGAGPFERYAVQGNHGQHTLTISLSADAFRYRMTKPQRDDWLHNARRRAASGRP